VAGDAKSCIYLGASSRGIYDADPSPAFLSVRADMVHSHSAFAEVTLRNLGELPTRSCVSAYLKGWGLA